ncbi:MAG: helix-turn-helix transcriptional regulator [bacterium]|nr:helix-turn-helix transcriptional regulator [bacterium]
MSLGSKLKQLRKDNDLSQEKLAEKLDTVKSHVGRYENDKTIPSADMVKRIALAFSVSADYLLFDESEKENITKISDKRLLKQFEEVDKMDEDDKDYIMKTIDLVINKNKIKQMVT